MRCIGARERCACATICTICASTVCAPTFSARITRLPLPLMVAPITRSPACFLDRHRLAGEHRLVDARAAFEHHAVDRHLFARAHAQPIADVHVRQRHILLGAVVADAPRGLRREAEQRLDGGRSLRARPQLEHLPQQRERNDHDRRLEIHADAAVRLESPRERCRARPSPPRCRRRPRATPMPISVHMLGLRVRDRLRTQRTKNGHAAQSTTGVRSTQFDPGAQRDRRQPGTA